MTNEYLAGEFMNYININYNRILTGFQKSSFKKEITNDVLHDSIINIYDSILVKGFKIEKMNLSGKSFENYLFIVVGNEILQSKRLIKRRGHNIHFENDYEFENCIENNTYNIDDEFISEKEMRSEDNLVDQIIKYIKSKYSHLDCGLFEFYFRSGLGYRKLADLTGFSTRTVFIKISVLKADIISKFKDENLPHRILIKDQEEKIKFKKIKDEDYEQFI